MPVRCRLRHVVVDMAEVGSKQVIKWTILKKADWLIVGDSLGHPLVHGGWLQRGVTTPCQEYRL